uniref:Uncharacterized protein n=1 Tax=Arundo donax TaxID=35708 RepID=A0A0A9E074_ARUDO
MTSSFYLSFFATLPFSQFASYSSKQHLNGAHLDSRRHICRYQVAGAVFSPKQRVCHVSEVQQLNLEMRTVYWMCSN